jgi:hypothetical protein
LSREKHGASFGAVLKYFQIFAKNAFVVTKSSQYLSIMEDNHTQSADPKGNDL